MCQEFSSILSPPAPNSGSKVPINSSRVSYKIIHSDPGILIARNLSNSSCLVKSDHGYRNQSYTNNQIMGLIRQCGFSYSKQVSTVTWMHVPRCPSHYISILAILYQHNSLIPCDCKSLGDSTPFMSVLEQTSRSARQHLEAYYKLRISDPIPDSKLDLHFIFFTNFTEVYLTNKTCT